MSEFKDQLKIQLRTIHALMIREAIFRYGRENLGFFWVFAEALVFVLPVLTMWHYIRPQYGPDGILWADISWSGYLPLMLYRHIGGFSLFIIRGNAGLFYHRVITTYDILFARIALEILSNIAAALFSMLVLVAVGEMKGPEDWSMLYIGYFYMIWWCAAIGLVVAGLCERSVWVEKIWLPSSYMYIALGGCFFLANWLPAPVRNVALLQPSLQAYEMIRRGMFGNKIPTYVDFGYATLSLSVLTIIGLASLRSARKLVMLQ